MHMDGSDAAALLPPELLLKVLHHLSVDLANAVCVSRKWQQVVSSDKLLTARIAENRRKGNTIANAMTFAETWDCLEEDDQYTYLEELAPKMT